MMTLFLTKYDFRPRINNDRYINKTRIKAGEITFGYFFNKFYQKFDSSLLRASLKDLKKIYQSI